MRVDEVMTKTVITASPKTPYPDLVEVMLDNGIGGVPIVSDSGELVGMVTEADLVSKEAYGGRKRRTLEFIGDFLTGGQSPWALKAKGRVAEELMTKRLKTTKPTEDVRIAALIMLENGVKRLPVVAKDGRVVGIVSRSDLLRTMHRSDDELTFDVRRVLADPRRTPDDFDVTVDINEGVVTVNGSVEHPYDLAVLTSIVWSVPGVVDVENRTVARRPNPVVTMY